MEFQGGGANAALPPQDRPWSRWLVPCVVRVRSGGIRQSVEPDIHGARAAVAHHVAGVAAVTCGDDSAAVVVVRNSTRLQRVVAVEDLELGGL